MIYLTHLWFFPRRLFWFALGIVFGFHIGDFKPFFVRHKNKFVYGAVLFYLLSLVEFEVLLALSGQPWIDFNFAPFKVTAAAKIVFVYNLLLQLIQADFFM